MFQWFWEVVESLTQEERVLLLQFVTGRFVFCSAPTGENNPHHDIKDKSSLVLHPLRPQALLQMAFL